MKCRNHSACIAFLNSLEVTSRLKNRSSVILRDKVFLAQKLPFLGLFGGFFGLKKPHKNGKKKKFFREVPTIFRSENSEVPHGSKIGHQILTISQLRDFWHI